MLGDAGRLEDMRHEIDQTRAWGPTTISRSGIQDLLRARDAFDLMGAPGWRERAEDGLRARGQRWSSSGRVVQSALSAREIEIVRCVRGGLTNAGVAQHLVLSENTIAQPLTRIYTKLGVANRRHAQRAFERLVVAAASSEFPSAK